MKKNGFVLVELLLATLLAGLIGVVIFSAFYQTNLSMNVADNIIDIYSKASLLQHQLEKDLVGVCIPIEATLSHKKNKEQETVKEKEQQPFTKLFFSSYRNGMFTLLTFITNDPLRIYWDAKVGKATPNIARVVYRLVESREKKGSYVLLRQESSQLFFDAFQEGVSVKLIRAYELINGIKELSVSYGGMREDKEKKDAQEKKSKEYKILSEWDADKIKEQQGITRMIPNFVKLTILLWDDRYIRSYPFTFVIPIITHFDGETKNDGPVGQQLEKQSPMSKEEGDLQNKKTKN
jgi:type II secretory pathway component PulJ